MLKSKGGFTLIELVMIIVILGILAAVAIPRYADLSGKAREAACDGYIGAMRSGISIDWVASISNTTVVGYNGGVAYGTTLDVWDEADNTLEAGITAPSGLIDDGAAPTTTRECDINGNGTIEAGTEFRYTLTPATTVSPAYITRAAS